MGQYIFSSASVLVFITLSRQWYKNQNMFWREVKNSTIDHLNDSLGEPGPKICLGEQIFAVEKFPLPVILASCY